MAELKTKETKASVSEFLGTIVGFDRYDYKYAALMKKPGKYKTGKSCLYFKRLEDVDQELLSRLIKESVKETHRIYDKS